MPRTVPTIVLLAALVHGSAAGSRDPIVKRPEAGDYRLVYLRLTAEDVKQTQHESQPGFLVVAMRDGTGVQAWVPIMAQGVDASGIALANGKLAGELRDTSLARPAGSTYRLRIDAAVDGSSVSGTWSRLAHQTDAVLAKGHVQGEVVAERALAKRQSFAEGAAWPSWRGPTHDRNAAPTGATLIDDLTQARPVWKSEAAIAGAPGTGNDFGRHGPGSLMNNPSGGGATPIVADGKVFLNYYRPSGDLIDRGLAKQYREQIAADKRFAHLDGKLPSIEALRIRASDEVIALDAHSGRLLWRTVFPDSGYNFTAHKNDINNQSMVYAEGRVYFIGCGFDLRCLDADTGELQWKRPMGGFQRTLEKCAKDCIAGQRRVGGGPRQLFNRAWGSAPVVVDGLVLANDRAGSLVAFDATSGTERWRAAKVISSNGSAHPWRLGERWWIITDNGNSLTCLAVADRSVLWRHRADVGDKDMLTVSGDILAYHDTVGEPGVKDRNPARAKHKANHVLVVARLTEKGPQVLWHTSWHIPKTDGSFAKFQHSQYVRPQIVDGKVFLSGQAFFDCWDAATGKHLARAQAAGGVRNAGHMFAAHGRLFSVRDGKHGTTNLAMLTTDPADFRPTGPDATWVPPHSTTTSYGPYLQYPIVDGRIFIRGHEGVYCYDLRRRDEPQTKRGSPRKIYDKLRAAAAPSDGDQ